ncbi:MAG: Flp pilus assembly complex ATPase component TadA [Candidatus Eisenbacteria bacterium]|uniref:Flp pilus assembly complex ATPase component TadA n=1 Tax=Eiseniibacteriota bacterium TaxID=2212470 RepID=A0A933SA86_UNCEI|nr:Flp pilus assembly complex ATPase component TadA [Candidatus Eisenbacteria bacterium]
MSAPRLSTRRLGEILIERGKLTPDQVNQALRERSDARERLGHTVVRLGFMTEAQVVDVLAEQFGMPIVTAEQLSQADREAVQLVPEALARESQILALRRDGDPLEVAVGDPLDVLSMDHVRALTGCALQVRVARPTEVREAIEGFYAEMRASEHLGEILDKIDLTRSDEDGDDVDLAQLRAAVEDAPVVRLVNLMIAEAIDQRASDIHVEPARDRVTVRFRIDGVLHEVMKPPRHLQMAIVSRIKVLADLDIAVRLLPQDGRLTVHLPDREVDLRVSTLPTSHGEKVVMRLFDKGAFERQISNLGLEGRTLDAFRNAIRQPYGMILISGPTGSGKTTTLYSALNDIRTVNRNLVTVEDPIEYHIDAVTQVHANQKVGLTFARALRSILRQDPDVIMIGEIRDTETADIAVKSALTGHLVFSTVHANDAPGTLTRLIDMGIPRYLVGSAMSLVMAQRLVRRVCERCKEPWRPEHEQLEVLGEDAELLRGKSLVRGRGCMACKQTGYMGRVALFEVLELTRGVRRMVLDGHNEDTIKKQAMADGFITLRKAGIRKILDGITTIDEVRSATLGDAD